MYYEQITTLEQALEFKGETLTQFNKRTKGLEVDTIGYEKLKVIVWAINGGENIKEGYWPHFYNPNRSSVEFSCNGYDYALDDVSGVGACLLFEDPDHAIYAGKTFPKEYSQFINATEE